VSFVSSMWFILLCFSCLSLVFFLHLRSRRQYHRMSQKPSADREQEWGQGLVEYALALILVATIVVAILILLGPTVSNMFNRIVTGVSSPASLYPENVGPPQSTPYMSRH
jgi:ABC-type Fe3+ transport system permease subunit